MGRKSCGRKHKGLLQRPENRECIELPEMKAAGYFQPGKMKDDRIGLQRVNILRR